MRQEDVVSLWVGNFSSEDALRAHLETSYSPDGDFQGSRFTRDFGIAYYDEDFFEAEFYQEPLSALRRLLNGFSYHSQIIPQFEALVGPNLPTACNSAVLLYNFRYLEPTPPVAASSAPLRFVGSVGYHS